MFSSPRPSTVRIGLSAASKASRWHAVLRRAVDHHGTDAAGGAVAAAHRPGQSDLFGNHLPQRGAGLMLHLMADTVEIEGGGKRRHGLRQRRCRRSGRQHAAPERRHQRGRRDRARHDAGGDARLDEVPAGKFRHAAFPFSGPASWAPAEANRRCTYRAGPATASGNDDVKQSLATSSTTIARFATLCARKFRLSRDGLAAGRPHRDQGCASDDFAKTIDERRKSVKGLRQVAHEGAPDYGPADRKFRLDSC